MKYQIVTSDETVVVDDVRAWAYENEHPFIGMNHNARQHPELQGQPKFKDLAGPFYGGEGIVRYEDWHTYRNLST